MIEICTVGGYSEVGKNMLAVKVDDEVVVLDIGLHLEPYIKYTEYEDVVDMSAHALTKIGAIPDVSLIKDWKKKVIAIIPSHAHLDHVGAVPFLSNKFSAPIIGTPFTVAVLDSICKSERIKLKNQVKPLNVNSSHKLSDNITVEFVNMCHSTPQTVAVVLHTKYGCLVYSPDFKLDSNPVLGKKCNIRRLKQIGKKGVVCLFADALNSARDGKTPSESVAREMLRDVMLTTESEGHAVIVTTFSSHLARLKSIVEFGKVMKRKIVFLGRSLAKYVEAGEEVGLVNFSKDVEICKFRKHVKRKLKKINQNKGDYLIVCTGHQGEQKAILSGIADEEFDFNLAKNDQVIFSCGVIPVPLNIAQRDELERKLKAKGARLFKDVHASGHASKEEIRDLVTILQPDNVVPAHGGVDVTSKMTEVLEEQNLKLGTQVHILQDGQRLKLVD